MTHYNIRQLQNKTCPHTTLHNNNKRVTFNTTDSYEQKIDKLTVMMGKLVTKNGQNRQFKPQVY